MESGQAILDRDKEVDQPIQEEMEDVSLDADDAVDPSKGEKFDLF